MYELIYYTHTMIKFILLGLLNYSPMTGYELKQTIDSSTSHFWHAHHSQIYTTLRKIEQEGLVISEIINEEGRPERRVYTITSTGKEILLDWLNKPLKTVSPVKEELLVRLFFSAQRDRQSVINELKFQRDLHQEVLASYALIQKTIPNHKHQVIADIENESKFWSFTIDMGIKYEQMYITWLNEVIQKIN